METDGAVEGSTLESIARLGELAAFLSGRRIGSDVSFTKVYDETPELSLIPIAYNGVADGALKVVQGRWRLIERNPHCGGFVMRRVSSAPVFELLAAQDVQPRTAGPSDFVARMAAIRARRRRR